MKSSRALTIVLSSVIGIAAGVLVLSPTYLVAWLIWPAGIHGVKTDTESIIRLAVIYGGGAIFWAVVAYAVLRRYQRNER